VARSSFQGGDTRGGEVGIIGEMSSWFRTYGFADVLDNLLIGSYPLDAEDVALLQRAGIERVLNLVEDSEYEPGERDAVLAAYAAAGISERRMLFTDYAGLPADEVEAAVSILSGWLNEDGRTYVHCRAGWQRSPAIAAGAIALRDGIDVDEALAYIHERKPSADPLPQQREDLRRWWEERDPES
jgi:protein-tyrosine phosphatase